MLRRLRHPVGDGRATAFLIDDLVLLAFTLPLAAAGFAGMRTGMLVVGAPAPLQLDEALTTVLEIGWFTMAAVYFTLLHRGAGQTIGKAIVGIRVRSLDLTAIGTLRSLLRTRGYAVSSSFLGLGFLMAAVTPHKRAWHDYVAGTRVVRLAPDEA